MKGKLFTALATIALGATFVTASAQNVAISQDGRPERMAAIRHNKGLNSADFKMLQEMYWGNAFEIKAGEIAVRRGQSSWAKEFGKEMVHEHTMAQNELKLIAADKGVRLSNNIPADLQNALRRLQNAPSSSFDNVYRASQMAAHSQASTVLQRAIKFGRDEDVRGFAIKMLPPTKDHYALAQIRQTMMGATKTRNGV
jgi:putative membrane protein